MSFGAGGFIFGFVADAIKTWGVEQGPTPSPRASPLFNATPDLTTLQPRCGWLDGIASPVSSLVDQPAAPPRPVLALQCSWAEQLSFLDRSFAPPTATVLPPQERSTWMDHIPTFDLCGIEPEPEVVQGSRAGAIQMLTFVAMIIAFVTLLKTFQWLWRRKPKLHPHLPLLNTVTFCCAAAVIGPEHIIFDCGVFTIPYICTMASWLLRKALLLRRPISFSEHRILQGNLNTVTESLTALIIANITTNHAHRKDTSTYVTHVANLDDQLQEEKRVTAELEAKEKKALGKINNLESTNEQLVQKIADLHDETEFAALGWLEESEQHASEVSRFTTALACASHLAQTFADNLDEQEKETQNVVARTIVMQHDFDTPVEAHTALVAQLNDASDSSNFKYEALAAEKNAVAAKNADLEGRLTLLIEEKSIAEQHRSEVVNASASQVAKLEALLAAETSRSEQLAEQNKLEVAEASQLRVAMASLREELAARRAEPQARDEHATPPHDLTEGQSMVDDTNSGEESERKTLVSEPTSSFVENFAGPCVGTVDELDQSISALLPGLEDGLQPEYLPCGTEVRQSDLIAIGSDIYPTSSPLDTPSCHVTLSTSPSLLPVSPPLTPPSASSQLGAASTSDWPTNTTEGLMLSVEEPALSSGDSNSRPSEIPPTLSTIPTSEPSPEIVTVPLSQRVAGSRANPLKIRLFDIALQDADKSQRTPTSSRTPAASATPAVTPEPSVKPHSWDVQPARVYPPGSDKGVSGGRPTFNNHKDVNYGRHWHRKSKKPAESS